LLQEPKSSIRAQVPHLLSDLMDMVTPGAAA
jgi:hypothetical protein